MVWKHIAVKEDVKKIVDEVAKRRGLKKYQVIELAIRQFAKEQTYKSGDKEYHHGYDVDRGLWYAFKLVNSVAQLKHAVEQKFDERDIMRYKKKTLATINQIETRLGVDLNNVKSAIDTFIETPQGKQSAKLNDETKLAMARIIFK